MNIACTICLDRFFLNSTISASPCGHLFHDTCLDRWLIDERKKTCPQCRTAITPKQILKKLYLLEPLCQTQVATSGQDSSELLQRIENQETKILESEQHCRKALNDLQKTEERRQAFEKDTVALRKQFNDQTIKYQRMINERDAKMNTLMEQYKHVDLSNKKDEQIKVLQMKLAEYSNIDLIYKGLANTFKSELHKMLGTCQTIQDKDRIIAELIRYNVILKEEHCKMTDDKQDLIKNLDRITAQCEKMQLEKRQATQRKTDSVDHVKQELASAYQQLESYKSRVSQLESLLDKSLPDVRVSTSKSKTIDDESSNDDDEIDSNMIDLTNTVESSSKTSNDTTFSTQQFSNSSSAIDILHSIIQQTAMTSDLPGIKKQKVRKLDDDIDDNQDYLVRPLINRRDHFQRTFNKFGGHSTISLTRRLSTTNSFKSKSRLNKPKGSSTRNNHKITTFFDLN